MFSCIQIRKQIKTTPGLETAAVWSRHHKSWLKMSPILLLTSVGVVSVHGHGGVVWPPSWQDGVGLGIEEVYNNWIGNWPRDKDPKTGKSIYDAKAWLTDQVSTEGHGEHKRFKGPHTNTGHCDMKWGEHCCADSGCAKARNPWAAPGVAESLGGGCGIHGGNPYGCPAPFNGTHDTRDPGSMCLSDTEDRGTWSYGSAAIDLDLPSMVTQWARGSIEPVAFVAIHHGGGYTYRLCKMPREGKTGLTEECFTKNILKFAENKSYWRNPGEENLGTWQEEPKTDLTVGTYPEGSAWRYFGPIDRDRDHGWYQRFFKDLVVVPEDLELGE